MLGYLLLAVCVCALFAAMFPGRRHGPLWAGYQKVRLGMTKERVEDILGPPDDEDTFGGGTSGRLFCTWREGEQSIVLDFHWSWDSRAVYELREKQFYPQTSWEQAQDYVKDLRRSAREWIP
jgi:hypothetical protein